MILILSNLYDSIGMTAYVEALDGVKVFWSEFGALKSMLFTTCNKLTSQTSETKQKLRRHYHFTSDVISTIWAKSPSVWFVIEVHVVMILVEGRISSSFLKENLGIEYEMLCIYEIKTVIIEKSCLTKKRKQMKHNPRNGHPTHFVPTR